MKYLWPKLWNTVITEQNEITLPARANAWFNFTCYHPPPGQPRGQVQPFGPGGGELFEAVLSRGEGGGANRK